MALLNASQFHFIIFNRTRKDKTMSSLCDIFPDDPSCAPPEPEPVPEPEPEVEDVDEEVAEDDAAEDEGAEDEGAEDAEAEMAVEKPALAGWAATKQFIDLMERTSISTFSGQVYYEVAALAVAGWTALQLFRYTARTNYWTNTKTGTNTNYNELSDTVINWGALVIMGVAALTQLMSMFGAMVDLNLMVWWYGVFGGIPLLHLTAYCISMLAYDQGHSDSNDSNAGNTQNVALAGIRSNLANGAFLFFTLLANYDSWFAAQWLGLSAESQQTMIDDLETRLKEMAAEKDAELAEKAGSAKAEEPAEEEDAEEGADEEGEAEEGEEDAEEE